MKHLHFLILAIASVLAVVSSAMASYDLASNGKVVKCYGPDNMDIILNAKRTTVKITFEGEGTGAQRIINKSTDNRTYASYTTEEGTLTLGEVNTFSDAEGTTASSEPYDVRCK